MPTSARVSRAKAGDHVCDSSLGSRLETLRSHRAARRVLSTVSVLLLLAGVGMFSYPFVTDVYTDQVLQERLDDELAGLAGNGAPGSVEEWQDSLTEGTALTRMVIPRLAVGTVVVEGISPAALRAGAGHYPATPLPGQPGGVYGGASKASVPPTSDGNPGSLERQTAREVVPSGLNAEQSLDVPRYE